MANWGRRVRRLARYGLVWGAVACLAAPTAPVTVTWQTLQTLNFNLPQSQQKAPVLQLAGKRVSIPGFMVPLEDDLNQVTEFLLVPYAELASMCPRRPQIRLCTSRC